MKNRVSLGKSMADTKGQAAEKGKKKVRGRGRRKLVTVDTSKAYSHSDVVRLVIENLGWKEYMVPRRNHPCDVIWTAENFHEMPEPVAGQLINRFPGSKVFRKSNLSKVLMVMKKLFPEEFDFFPQTWLLPAQYDEFYNDVTKRQQKKGKRKATYIIKPSEGAQGEGIYLLRDPRHYRQLNSQRLQVAQEYLSDVLLLDGYKFDLRVYVLVRSLDPLRIYLCEEGLVRLSTVPYKKPSDRNMHETFMHLTNYSLNKRSSNFCQSDKDEEGSKRKLSTVFRQLRQLGHDTDHVWQQVEDIVRKTMLAVAGELRVEHNAALPPGKPQPTCFQVVGFDILILKDLRAVLLEVNSSPSLCISAEEEKAPGIVYYTTSLKDQEVKGSLVRDTLIMMAPPNKYTRIRRRKWKQQQLERVEENGESSTSGTATEIASPEGSENERGKDLRDQGTSTDDPCCSACADPSDPQGSESTEKAAAAVTNHQSSLSDDQQASPPSEDNEASDEEEEEEDKEEEEEEEECCLREIFPGECGDDMEQFRVMEKLAEVFISCVSIRDPLTLGSTSFRAFSRKFCMNQKGLSNAALDILFIEMQRKWELLDPYKPSGLSFQGFVDTCLEISRRYFASPSSPSSSSPSSSSPLSQETLEAFINSCHSYLGQKDREEE